MGENRTAGNKKITGALKMAVLIILFLMFIFPFVLVVINVFKTKGDITSNPLALVGEHGFTLKNFPEAMRKMDFFRAFGNSAFITVISTALTLLLSSMTAYVIVRNDWKATKLLLALMIASMVIPFQVLMIPLVSLWRRARRPEPPRDADLHACGIFPVNGDVYVSWRDQDQCAGRAGGSGHN